jgi:hypothetical protein
MKDKELKLERHTHYLESYGHTEVGVGLPQKPKNLSTYERVECGHGESGGVYVTLLQSKTLFESVMGECVI